MSELFAQLDDNSLTAVLEGGLLQVDSDTSAIHKNQSGEISTITEKTSLADDDLFLIEDSAAANVKKKVKKSTLSTILNAETDPVFVASEAYNITSTDITNLGNLSGTNTGDQDLSGYSLTSHNHNLNDLTEKSYNSLTDKPTIPTALADLSEDSTHRIITDVERALWNAKQAALSLTLTSLATGFSIAGGATSKTLIVTDMSTISGLNTGDQDLSSYALKSNVLELDNTTPFTPDANYEPATKKYVDDNLGNNSGIDFTTKIELTNAEILDLHNTPKTLVAGQGSDKVLLPMTLITNKDSGANYSNVQCTLQSDLNGTDWATIQTLTTNNIETAGVYHIDSSGDIDYQKIVANNSFRIKCNDAITDLSTSGSYWFTIVYRIFNTTTNEFVGNLNSSDPIAWGSITGSLASQADLTNAINAKQDTLVSGTNIKTINSETLLGSGNISVSVDLTSITTDLKHSPAEMSFLATQLSYNPVDLNYALDIQGIGASKNAAYISANEVIIKDDLGNSRISYSNTGGTDEITITGDNLTITTDDIAASQFLKTDGSNKIITVDLSTTFADYSHNHSGTYEPADATILKSAAIGVSVQGYDADTMKTDGIESVTALKTFDKDKIALKGTSTGKTVISTANTSVTDYTATFPAKDGTVAMTSDITGGGHTIQDEGTPLTARTNLNFVGAGVTVTDDSGNSATKVTISGGAGGGDFLVMQVFS